MSRSRVPASGTAPVEKISNEPEAPRLFHKEARTFQKPDGQTQWETRCGLTLDNALDLVHPLEDMVRAAANPHILARRQVPCLDCMSQVEKAQIIDRLLEDPATKAETLRAMDRTTPGNSYVELALAYETNEEFKEWLNTHIFNEIQRRDQQVNRPE